MQYTIYISSLVCGAVVACVPSEHMHLCSDKCTFYADGVCKIMLAVTCDHAVLANIIGYIAPHPLPSPWYTQHRGFHRYMNRYNTRNVNY